MSCVADIKASSQKKARVILKKCDAGIVRAMLAKPRAMTSCVITIHHRLVLSISTSGMTDGKKLNGIAISAYHHAMITNGISANFYNNTSGKLNGIHVSGFANNSDKGAGITVAAMGNYSENFSGIQLAFFNKAKSMKGVQIGLSNKSDKLKGLQVGLWNKNGKRSLPIFNF